MFTPLQRMALLALTLALAPAARAQAPELVRNGDFSPDSFSYPPMPWNTIYGQYNDRGGLKTTNWSEAWTGPAGSPVWGMEMVCRFDCPAAESHAFSQTITGLTQGASYALSFLAAGRNTTAAASSEPASDQISPPAQLEVRLGQQFAQWVDPPLWSREASPPFAKFSFAFTYRDSSSTAVLSFAQHYVGNVQAGCSVCGANARDYLVVSGVSLKQTSAAPAAPAERSLAAAGPTLTMSPALASHSGTPSTASSSMPATLAVSQSVRSPVPATVPRPYTFRYAGSNGWHSVALASEDADSPVSSSPQALRAFHTDTLLGTRLRGTGWHVAEGFRCVDINPGASGNPAGMLVTAASSLVRIPAAYVRPGAKLRCSLVLRYGRP